MCAVLGVQYCTHDELHTLTMCHVQYLPPHTHTHNIKSLLLPLMTHQSSLVLHCRISLTSHETATFCSQDQFTAHNMPCILLFSYTFSLTHFTTCMYSANRMHSNVQLCRQFPQSFITPSQFIVHKIPVLAFCSYSYTLLHALHNLYSTNEMHGQQHPQLLLLYFLIAIHSHESALCCY